MITAEGSTDAIWATDHAMRPTYVTPYDSSEVAGVQFLPDGTLLLADEGNGAIVRLDLATGAWSAVVGSVTSPNSLAVQADGLVLFTAFDRLMLLDPQTGWTSELALHPGQDLDGVTLDDTGVWFNEDATGNVVHLALPGPAEPEVRATFDVTPGDAELDGMAGDVCGNLYVLRTDGRISRIEADGAIEESWVELKGRYVSALHFGNGVGGWERDHLYVMDRDGWLHDLPVGIEGRATR